ncbi:hypothetical protein LVD17_21035 [Fulvivirga ulvae]|uniref:hypothetical protein n=1 Tax=Fulvivirga ulvae TaxID=2904245 RepID=UPI001F29F922|nr:hypothetical protein [Fulvivirga ulvae]UII30782.1 hypothetical protein LVD17_21035 [Fulvivirga ulvae]
MEIENYLKANDTLSRNQQRIIIKGVVLSSDTNHNLFNKYGRANVVNIKVLEYWPSEGLKYIDSDTITIFNDESDCAVNFKKDSVCLVRAYTFNRYLGTSICEGTKLLSESEDDLTKLGVGDKPIISSTREGLRTEGYKPKQEGHYLSIFLTISLCINVLLIYLLLKRRKT